ncbi:MAG: sigma-54 dependent transcriptional regulator [Bacteroidales bacterium]|nr:sigma-54 dependent transcriptional regulator [Bacteroidales bacterium]
MHNMDLVQIKQRFDIIGDNPELNRALEIARQVAGTDLSVLVTGESGVGKEVIPQIIHQNSPRKHGVYIAVNCGAIPEGTIDSELFGHEKGSFTGALETRKGYFEEADGGTLFLDEVAELPLSTQVRLLRVLQTGEFLKVGSSKVQKTDVRVIAATNINLMHAIEMGRFREDLYYRLNTVPIMMPPLRDRKEDIYLLFRKFALDFADKYMMPVIKLNPLAQEVLESYRWPGNVRQLKSVAEQISVLEHERLISAEVLKKYLPLDRADKLPVRTADAHANADYTGDRDIIFKILFQLRKDVDDLKAQMGEGEVQDDSSSQTSLVNPLLIKPEDIKEVDHFSIQEVNADLIKKALEKHGGKRKAAAEELGISERTLYRKIKELGID